MRPSLFTWLRFAVVLAGLLAFHAVAQAQAITSGQVGVAYTFAVTTNPPAPAGSVYGATNLPGGLSINSDTGVISGTPTTPGTATGIISITSGTVTNNYDYTLTIAPAAGSPAITSTLTATGTVNTLFTYTIVASNSPTSYNVGPAPTGLSYNGSTSNPQITGTPTAAGTYPISLSANNGAGAGASVTLTLTINPAGPVPAVTSAVSASSPVNTAFTYTITASNGPTSFSASGLPVGLSLNSGTGVISGSPSVTGVYTVTLGAANGNGAGPTTALTLTVGALSTINSATTLTATVNQAASFALTASNSPVSFNLNGLPPGLSVNTATGVISGTPSTTGTFTLSASANNAAGTGPTATITLTVAAAGGGGGGGGGGVNPVAPIITTQPASQSVAAGATVTFSVAAAGTGTLTYQWSLGGFPLAGATGATLTLTNVQSANAGSYAVAVTNAVGTTPSSTAILTVIPPVTITTQPASQTVKPNAAVTFTVIAPGATSYQWQFNGSAIAGATGSSYTIAAATGANVGSYTVVVANANGSVTSAGAILAVQGTGAPAISTQPQSLTLVPGATVILSVTASGTVTVSSLPGDGPTAEAASAVTYQWYWNGVAVSSGTQSTLLIPNVSAANDGNYNCLVSNAAGSTLSSTAVLTVAATSNPGRLINLSILSDIQGSLTMGFVNGGFQTSGAETVLIRGVGPAIGTGTIFNVPNVMPDPTLNVVQQHGGAFVAANSGWGVPASSVATIQGADAATGAFALSNSASLDSALVASLPSVTGGYSATIAGKSGDSGWALTEVYDDTPLYTPASTRLINLSCLTQIATGGTLDVGFVIGGTTAKTVLIRVAGPALNTLYGIAGVMPDPQFQATSLSSSTPVFAFDAGWGGNAQSSAIATAVGAYAWPNPSSLDSAAVVTLAPGPYTVQVSSTSGAGGTVLVEIYDVP